MGTREMRGEVVASPDQSTASVDLVSEQTMKWGTLLLLAYFGARLLYLALSVSSYVPPDEVTHAGLCRVFSQAFLLPGNSPETYRYGLVTNIPWLYYWSMGKLLHLNFSGLPDLVFLRLLNIPLAFGTVWYSLRLLRLLTEDRLTRLLLLVVATNLAMFTLLSASVSYDNLTNLFAAMSAYYLFAYFRKRSADLLAASLLSQLAGCLTKVTFLPLVIVLLAALLIHERSNLGRIPAAVAQYFRGASPRSWSLIALSLIALALNVQLYGGNCLKYGTPMPTMSAVLSPEAAMQYRMDARGMIFSQFRDGKISYMDAVVMAGNIQHPGDKADTFFLLMNWQKMKNNPELWMGPFAYLGYWFRTMSATIFGIKGHLSMLKNQLYMAPVYLVMGLAAFGFLLRWRPREGVMPLALAAVALSYAGFLMYRVNYDSYLDYGAPSLTVYGRYLFPITVPVCVLGCHYLLRLFRNGSLRIGVALATALLFICYDFPWFLAHATPEWFSWMPH